MKRVSEEGESARAVRWVSPDGWTLNYKLSDLPISSSTFPQAILHGIWAGQGTTRRQRRHTRRDEAISINNPSAVGAIYWTPLGMAVRSWALDTVLQQSWPRELAQSTGGCLGGRRSVRERYRRKGAACLQCCTTVSRRARVAQRKRLFAPGSHVVQLLHLRIPNAHLGKAWEPKGGC